MYFLVNIFLKNIFAVGGESQTEIFGYNTKSLTFLKKLGKFTNWLKNYVVCPEITNNISSFGVGIKNLYFQFSIISKHFLKKL